MRGPDDDAWISSRLSSGQIMQVRLLPERWFKTSGMFAIVICVDPDRLFEPEFSKDEKYALELAMYDGGKFSFSEGPARHYPTGWRAVGSAVGFYVEGRYDDSVVALSDDDLREIGMANLMLLREMIKAGIDARGVE